MSASLRWLSLALLVPPSAAVLTLVPLKERYPDAVCVDGSSSGYYWKAATSEEGENAWIVYLQAGGWCWDSESCEKRCEGSPGLCSSTVWESERDETGIFSHDVDSYHPVLRNANKVFVRYCTSDAHMGNAEAFGLQFRGARVVQAVLSDLVATRGLGSDQHGGRQLLIFGGGSAGSRGAMVHLDYVPSMLGKASQNVDIVGFLDSPLWLDIQPLNETFFEGFANQTHHVYDFANVTHLDSECAATFNESAWRCMLGEYRMPFVKSRYLLIAAQHDGFQLYYDTGHDKTWTADQLHYAAQFSEKTSTLMSTLASTRHAVYSPSCKSHAESLWDNPFFNHTTDDGTSQCQALQEFLGLESNSSSKSSSSSGGGDNHSFKWIDTCHELDCGKGCHRGEAPKAADIGDSDDEAMLLSNAHGSFVSGGMAAAVLLKVWLLRFALP
mmetsp:Transcript_82332/g.207767  ORF Transcript_82332/g.207767 Transcript_82332/m.207767 type:complete len:441 (-) Transcript_82332:149-1471(-)